MYSIRQQLRHLFVLAQAAGVVAISFAACAHAAPAEVDATVPAASAAAASPMQRWQEWLSQGGFRDGVNYAEDGKSFRVFTYSEARVADGPADRFTSRRNIAYAKATLQAKAELSKTVQTAIESEQLLHVMENAGEQAPPMIQEAMAPISLMDKAATLADKALDQEIKKFDPSWDGTGRSPAERNREIARLQESYRNNLAARSRLFVSGALPAAVFEGPNARGEYSVGVGMVWSLKSQQQAQAIIDPGERLPATTPGKPIDAQIAERLAKDPAYLASACGVSIVRNERGEPTVLAYSSVDTSPSSFRDESMLRDLATQMLQTFVGEQVVAQSEMQQELVEQHMASGTVRAYDASKYETQIKSAAPRQKISGLQVVHSWQGKHAVSGSPMTVRVFGWSPSSQASATELGALSEQKESVVRRSLGEAPAGGLGNAGGRQDGITRAGQSTNPTEF